MVNIKLYFARRIEGFLLYAARFRRKKNGWDNVTIGQFQRIMLAKELSVNNTSTWVEIVGILEGVEYKEVLNWTVSKFNKAIIKYSWIDKHELNTHVDNSFTIDGIEYFITKELPEITTGQLIDNTELCKTPSQIYSNMHKILALFCMPKGQKDHTINFEKRAEIFKEKLSINIAHGLSSFFLKSSTAYLIPIQNYWTERAKMEVGMKRNTDG